MKSYPIIFTADMIKAIMLGTKTQTRRLPNKRNSVLGLHITEGHAIQCPRYEVGDALWVRETWAQDLEGEIFYAADHLQKPSTIEKWKSPIFMPRVASRITLEITRVRVEHVQDITEEDAVMEGGSFEVRVGEVNWLNFRHYYECLWDSINGKGSFSSNPTVFVFDFKKIKP